MQNKSLKKIKRFLPLYIMFLPAGIWVGFKNFEYLFKTSDAWIITRNTLLYNIVFIILNTVVCVMLAILLNEIRSKVGKNILQSVLMLPYLISMVIISYLVYAFLSGESGFINNTVLKMFGMEKISWYAEEKYWPFILTFVQLWKNCGYLCIVYFSAVVGIDPTYYEAAALDGATKWQQIKYVVLPELTSVITIMVLLGISKIFYSDFGLFYQIPMNAGALYNVTNTIDVYVYNALLSVGNISMSSAAGFYQSVVGFVVVLLANWIVRKKNPDNALF